MTELTRRNALLGAALLPAVAGSPRAVAAQQPAPASARSSAAPAAPAAWDLTDLYASDAAWDADRRKAVAMLPGIHAYAGRLGQSAASLAAALQAQSDASRLVVRLNTYASLKADEDVRVAAAQERKQVAGDLMGQLAEATAFIAPEILAIGKPRITGFVSGDKALAKFRFQLDPYLPPYHDHNI